MTTETFAERRARVRAELEAKWQAEHGPMCLTKDDPINPHKHVANTEPGTRCMVDRAGLCHIPHDCRCPILFACMGKCYEAETDRSVHPNRENVLAPIQGPALPEKAPSFEWQQVWDALDEWQPHEQVLTLIQEAQAADRTPPPVAGGSEDRPEGALALPIDRMKWEAVRDPAFDPDGTFYNIQVDGLDLQTSIIEDADGFTPVMDEHEWPFEGGAPHCRTLEEAVDQVRQAMQQFWGYCSACGDETTEEDRALYLPYADDIGAYCANCRGAN